VTRHESTLAVVERERDRAIAALASASTVAEVEGVIVAALGRKAPMSDAKKRLGELDEEERRAVGRALNEARVAIEAAATVKRDALQAHEQEARLAGDRVDVTLPGRGWPPGHPHPATLVMDRIIDVFVGMGYRVAEGPEVETEWYAFDALNMPPDHPARSEFDTMFIAGEPALVRPHTSPVQIRTMLSLPPPVYVVTPGRCYRRDAFDASHSPVFHQIEGLAVDRGISFADLKGTLVAFTREIFGPDERLRFRPSFFPFTEPSAEVDVSCPTCHGPGCSACGWSGWLEILGAGMVHPNVLRAGGYDPQEVSGFAFGMGPERIAMVAYGITDIRQFWDDDLRFVAGFSG
jgi:phenylalanyl-tRNA synthetase alpha chain